MKKKLMLNASKLVGAASFIDIPLSSKTVTERPRFHPIPVFMVPKMFKSKLWDTRFSIYKSKYHPKL